MKTIIIILSILFCHWLFDFVFQTDEQAKGKSKSWEPLLEHTTVYSMCWLIPIMIYVCIFHPPTEIIIAFVPITFIFHTATDYYTSRVNAQLWKDQKVHDFFVSIGFDQFLHYAQLLLTFYLLT